MTRFADGPVVEVSVSIDAPVEAVWDLVTDINIAARFQDEFQEADWLDDGPHLGARFVGRNRMGDQTWETTSTIVAFQPGALFRWAVEDVDNPVATWTFELIPAEYGTRLSFHRVVGPGRSGLTWAIKQDPDHEEEIIALRDAQHLEHMQAVLDGIKELAESG
ncbi:MAG: SRPBCC family protein [Actinomycetia bacterium]|nr:SRPBCC family protein [Actinomycetes bacterium]